MISIIAWKTSLFNTLPAEIIHMIAERCDIEDHVALLRTNRWVHSVAQPALYGRMKHQVIAGEDDYLERIDVISINHFGIRGGGYRNTTKDPINELITCDNDVILRRCFDRGLSINSYTLEGQSLLNCSIRSGSYAVLDLLMARGADPNLNDIYGTTYQKPLSVAIDCCEQITIQRLLLAGASVAEPWVIKELFTKCCARTIKTALDCGARIDHVDSDPNSDEDGANAAHYAAENTTYRVVAPFSRRLPISVPDSRGYTPLHVAIYFNNHQAIRDLLNAGADVNAVPQNGKTVLHMACKYRLEWLVKDLVLKRGAVVNRARYRGGTELHSLMLGIKKEARAHWGRVSRGVPVDGEFLFRLEATAAEISRVLILGGVDTKDVNDEGYTAADLARQVPLNEVSFFLEVYSWVQPQKFF